MEKGNLTRQFQGPLKVNGHIYTLTIQSGGVFFKPVILHVYVCVCVCVCVHGIHGNLCSARLAFFLGACNGMRQC